MQTFRELFGHWPDAVWDQWLAREISRLHAATEVDESEMESLLEQTISGRPIRWWRGVHWTNEHKKIDIVAIAKTDRFPLDELVRLYRANAPNDAYGAPNSRQRLRSQIEHLTEMKAFSMSPLLLETPAGTKIIDGFHRIAALMTLELAETKQTVWMARHSG